MMIRPQMPLWQNLEPWKKPERKASPLESSPCCKEEHFQKLWNYEDTQNRQ